MLWELEPTVLDKCAMPLQAYRLRHTGLGIQTNKLRLTTKSAQQRVKMFVYDDCMNLALSKPDNIYLFKYNILNTYI